MKERPMPTKSDIVYTPRWCAEDMVRFFSPSGIILEPCRGGGAFLEFLPPETHWCEIVDGKDFYQWQEPVDWLVSNPPYSQTREWLRHSYRIAENILYLIPFRNMTSGYGLLTELRQYGWLKHVRIYGTGGLLNFPMGNAIAAFHIARGYRGATEFSFYQEEQPILQRSAA